VPGPTSVGESTYLSSGPVVVAAPGLTAGALAPPGAGVVGALVGAVEGVGDDADDADD
jgi:hypothetical protein